MSYKHSIDLSELFQQVDHLLGAHAKRNPQHDALADLTTALDQAEPGADRANVQIALAKIALARHDVRQAVEHLGSFRALDTPEDVSNRAVLALTIAQSLGGKRSRGSAPIPSDVASLFDILLDVVKQSSVAEGARVEMFALMASRHPLQALILAVELAVDNPQAIADINYIMQRVFSRSYSPATLIKVDRILKPLVKSSHTRAVTNNSYFYDLEARARSARVGGEYKPEFETVTAYLSQRGSNGARAIVRAKDLFLSVYPDDERIKSEIVGAFRLAVAEQPSGQAAKRLIECAAQTASFWQNEENMAAILSEAALASANEQTGETEFVKGIIGFLNNDMNLAGAHFAAAAPLSRQLSLTGATSFFNDLVEEDEEQFSVVDTNYDFVKRSRFAYVCCADEAFFSKHAVSYASSARRFDNQTQLHFHIAAPSLNQARELFVSTMTGIENVTFSWERPALSIPTYYASMRFLRLQEFLRHVADRVVLTDIDVEFRSSPGAFINNAAFDSADVGFRIYDKVRIVRQAVGPKGLIYRYPRILPWSVVNAACLVINATDAGLAAAETIARDMRRHLGRALKVHESAWWIDQNSLFKSLRLISDNGTVDVVNLEDIGIPFGSFNYFDKINIPSQHSALRNLQTLVTSI